MSAKMVKKRYVAPILMLMSAVLLWGLGPAELVAQSIEQTPCSAHDSGARALGPSVHAD